MHMAFMVNPVKFGIAPLLINISTLSKVHHSELIFTDGTVLTADPEHGVYYTKNTYDRFHWVLVPLPWINVAEEKVIRKWADDIVQQKPKYDWRGAIFGGFLYSLQNPNRWFCSELCAEAIMEYTPALKDGVWYSPNGLWKCLSEYLNTFDSRYSEVWKFRYRKTKESE